MKKLLLSLLSLIAVLSVSADEWVGLGTGAYQPGLLDYYGDEYPDLMPAAVYESTEHPGVYKFVPTPPAAGVKVVYEVVVHATDPDKVWCEDAPYYQGFFNLNTRHKVKETSDYDIPANYGKMVDGVITFSTPNSFMVIEMMGPKPTNVNGNFALYMPGKSPADDPVVNDTWEVMGIGKYVEGLLDCEYKAGIAWDVEIERSVETPGCYRLKPYWEGNPSCPKLPEVADTYVYIHAEDELEVYTSDFVLLNNRGVGYKIQHRAHMGKDSDYSYYGTMEDGVISFPANSHVAKIIGIDGAGSVPTNISGRACIVLPGYKYYDYYVEVQHPTCAISSKDGFCSFPITMIGGADVASIIIAVEAGTRTIDDINVNDYLTSTAFPNAFFGMKLNMNFPMVADQFNTNRWSLISLAIDQKKKVKNTAITTFFTPEEDAEWEDYGKGVFTDLFLGPSYMAMNEHCEVAIQKRKGSKGQLRLVDPYVNHPVTGSNGTMKQCADHHHYIYINADDPQYVYIEEAPTGVNYGYGDIVASSAVGSLLNQGLSLEQVKAQGALAGEVKGDDIVFPKRSLYFFETEYKGFLLQEGDQGTLLHITEYVSGIQDVLTYSDSDAPIEYYDLRGVRVDQPQPGSLYIQRQGSKATKVIVR